MLNPYLVQVECPPILQLMEEEKERLKLSLYGRGGWMVLQKHGLYGPVKVVELGKGAA